MRLKEEKIRVTSYHLDEKLPRMDMPMPLRLVPIIEERVDRMRYSARMKARAYSTMVWGRSCWCWLSMCLSCLGPRQASQSSRTFCQRTTASLVLQMKKAGIQLSRLRCILKSTLNTSLPASYLTFFSTKQSTMLMTKPGMAELLCQATFRTTCSNDLKGVSRISVDTFLGCSEAYISPKEAPMLRPHSTNFLTPNLLCTSLTTQSMSSASFYPQVRHLPQLLPQAAKSKATRLIYGLTICRASILCPPLPCRYSTVGTRVKSWGNTIHDSLSFFLLVTVKT